MKDIKVSLATERDRQQLMEHFRHYKISSTVRNRVDCYLSHNFTVIAKDSGKIIGILQWHVKEDPNHGVAEFEEVHVSRKYRRMGIGSLLVKFAINSVRGYFKKAGIKPRKIFIFVDEDNKPARALYEKHGFVPISKAGTLFSDKEMELICSLDM